MEPQPALNLIPTIQQAITNLLTTHEPEFLRFGYGLFMALATIVIAWQGIRMMLSGDGVGEQLFDFAKLLLFVAFGYLNNSETRRIEIDPVRGPLVAQVFEWYARGTSPSRRSLALPARTA